MTDHNSNLELTAQALEIPPEIPLSWIKGEYLIGAGRGAGYEYIGWSLLVRGAYVYRVHQVVEEEGKDDILTHWGVCKIDIQDSDLTYSGIRLYSNPDALPDDEEGSKQLSIVKPACQPLYWQSVFSRIVAKQGGKPHLYFGYRVYNQDCKEDRYASILRASNKFMEEVAAHQGVKGKNREKYLEASCSGLASDAKLKPETRRFLSNYLRDSLFVEHLAQCEAAMPQEEIVALVHLELEKWELVSGRDAPVQGTFLPVGYHEASAKSYITFSKLIKSMVLR